jgi:hypothetical protein
MPAMLSLGTPSRQNDNLPVDILIRFLAMDFPAKLLHWTPWIDAVSVAGVAVGVAKAFDWFDGLISDESRVALWIYMADVPSDERIDSWGRVFPKWGE